MEERTVHKGLLSAALLSLGALGGGATVKKIWRQKYLAQKAELETRKEECDLLQTWLRLEQKGAECHSYLRSCGYQRVAVFGMNWEGRQLAESLGEMAVYGVELDDPNAVHERMTVYRLTDDPLPSADCMVVCDLVETEKKVSMARKEFAGEILTLGELLTCVSEFDNGGKKN